MAGALLDALGIALLGLGLTLATIGVYGLLRRPNTFHQLHAAGLVTGPAVILVLFASVASRSAAIVTSAAAVVVFVLITAPLSGHAIAQAARHRLGDAGSDAAPQSTSGERSRGKGPFSPG